MGKISRSDILLIIWCTGCAFLLLLGQAKAHDELNQSDWIGQSHAANKQGQTCCGWNDCPRILEQDTKDLPDGVHAHVRVMAPSTDTKTGVTSSVDQGWDEIIPYSEVQPSADGFTYRCAWPTIHNRKCFFHKMPGT